jgi:hypothetical protein
MDITKKRRWIAVLLAGTLAPAAYASENALTDCVDLGDDREIVRSGSSESFLLRDGDTHYLVSLRGGCGLTTASKIEIKTDGAGNRLCATGSKVQTNRAICQVAGVETIGAEQFAQRKKRAAR